MEQQRERRISRTGQAGFSLLEMLVALAILSAAAYVALDTVESDTGQTRYQITENRLEKIRRAIVGNPDLVLNGSPVVSGYVADVGRLPECLEQLVAMVECDGTGTYTPPAYEPNAAPGLGKGWRGPYLTTEPTGIGDGWGTPAQANGNWGWNVTATATTFDVSSLGQNRAVGGDAGTYEVDQNMVQVATHDFQVDLNHANFQVHVSAVRTTAGTPPPPPMDAPNPPLSKNYCLALLDVDPVDLTKFRLIPAAAAGPTAVTIPVDQPSTANPVTLSFTANQTTMLGHRPLVLYEATGAACLETGDEAQLNDLSTPGAPKNPVVARFGLVLAPRMAHTGTYSATVSIVEP